MRIAVLADVHGNLPAFEAALEHVRRQNIDITILIGDMVVGSPDSAACWTLAQSLGVPMLRGNHERYVGHFGTAHAAPEWASERFGPVRWAAEQFAPAERETLIALPATLRLAELPDLLLVHGSLRSDQDTVMAYTPDAQLAAMFPDVAERMIVRAHNHVGLVKPWGEKAVVTTGSVGLALDGHPTAQYLVLERKGDSWRVEHQSTPYDVDAAVRRFYDTGYLESAGPMARLFLREVATASFHVVPFLRAYSRWATEQVPLGAAVDRFLSMW